MEISLYGLCNEVVVHDGLQQPWYLFGVSSKYGSLEGVSSRCSQDLLVIAIKLGEIVTLAYIPSEQIQDEIRYVNTKYTVTTLKPGSQIFFNIRYLVEDNF